MKNKFEIRGDVTAIFLHRHDGSIHETLIDTAMLDRANEFSRTWYPFGNTKINEDIYVYGRSLEENGKLISLMLHRWLMNCPSGMVVDHINHDTLDNRSVNLRIVTVAENRQNIKGPLKNNKTSGILGVCWSKHSKKWRVRVTVNNKEFSIGYYKNLYDAEVASINARCELMPFSLEATRRRGQSG